MTIREVEQELDKPWIVHAVGAGSNKNRGITITKCFKTREEARKTKWDCIRRGEKYKVWWQYYPDIRRKTLTIIYAKAS